ncbi:MAG TPA: hypothetical protein VKE41_19175 [Roseiflexaceae bacterium]|nr:hypothetical protein [Roseiflexaceae bacterium]
MYHASIEGVRQERHPDNPARTFIVYACPVGELAAQIERYYAVSRELCGPNAAHDYIPHCSLTGFFHDDLVAIPDYVEALDSALQRARPARPNPVLGIERVELREDFHGLLLGGTWLKALIADFARTVRAPTRRDALRLKDWLHLSLAYAFPSEQDSLLAKLAQELVDITAPVGWELRLYERDAQSAWICHARWQL